MNKKRLCQFVTEPVFRHQGIVTGVIPIIETQATRYGTTLVSEVRLKVERLCAVEPQQLSSCFEIFTEGAELVIDVIGVRGRCRACATKFEVPRFRFECPNCAGNDIEVIQGQELYTESFETDNGTAAVGDCSE